MRQYFVITPRQLILRIPAANTSAIGLADQRKLCVNRLISATIGAPRLLVAVIFYHHYTDTYYSYPNRNSRRLWPLGPWHDLDHARAQGPRLTAALPWLVGSSDRPLAHFIPPLQHFPPVGSALLQAFGL